MTNANTLSFDLPPQADSYYTIKEKMVKQLTGMANRVFAPAPASRKMPEDIREQDIEALKAAYAKIIEASDILESINL